ncbi:MAG: T9SS C-terminal target domain-containing protein [Candidatus Thermochlorobacter aerophilum]|uniref:T9SS C-terminal target domain-containing protein n=1 Tax=Candidatus Thermochlorobacter aerophilus TaxID=1868324 RepID=A0A395LXB8_9BACT|nr:MAG: T9SS C-terminal target domain-containing protein [Candidatus Thermochlorobacter aerophilum]
MRVLQLAWMWLLCAMWIAMPLWAQKHTATLSELERKKLHPVFQDLLHQWRTAGGQNDQFFEILSSPRSEATLIDGRVHAVVWTQHAEAIRAKGLHINSNWGKFVTLLATPKDLQTLALMPEVAYVDMVPTSEITDDVSMPEIGANLLHSGFLAGQRYTGRGAIILIIDSGIDWRHLDFRDPNDTTRTRILSIWDQTLTAQAGETPPAGFNYGVEYTQAQINAALAGGTALRTTDQNGHGTHVAGIAAGNGLSYAVSRGNLAERRFIGVAPEADIIVVRAGVGREIRGTWIDGLQYAQNRANALGRPIVINMSFGTTLGPHDGTDAGSLAIDALSNTPGRICVTAAGNSGADSLHIAGTIAARGSVTIEFQVQRTSQAFTSGASNDGFEFELWFNSDASATAVLTAPNGNAIFTANSGQSGTASDNTQGTVSFSNSVFSGNNHRRISFSVRDVDTTLPPAAGTWRLTISNLSQAVAFDGYRNTLSNAYTVRVVGGDNQQTVGGTLNSARRAITVGSYATRWFWQAADGQTFGLVAADRTGDISTFSSLGPTRDGRIKPELAAPGQMIIAALSSNATNPNPPAASSIVIGGRHQVLNGTSMAAPHVSGTVALMLSINPNLTWEQVRNLLQQTANADAFTGSTPNNTWGAGKLDALEAVARVQQSQATVRQTTLIYDQNTAAFAFGLRDTRRFAVRFTPTVSGRITGAFIRLVPARGSSPVTGAGPLNIEIFSNNAGLPGARLGNVVTQSFAQLSGGNSYLDLQAARVDVVAGTDYHLVLSLANPASTDTLLIAGDNGSVPTNRSSVFQNGQWANFDGANSPLTGTARLSNLIIRPVITTVTGISSVERETYLPPLQYELSQNYPNPFNPETTIRFSIARREEVLLEVFDVLGRKVATLVNEQLAPGSYVVRFNAATLSSGIYFYRMRAGAFSQSKKMMLIK